MKKKESLSVILLICITIAFFLPWYNIGILTLSGYNIPNFATTLASLIKSEKDGTQVYYLLYLLYLIPVLSLGAIMAMLMKSRMAIKLAMVAGSFPLIMMLIAFLKDRDITFITESMFGMYLLIISSITLIIVEIQMIKDGSGAETLTTVPYKPLIPVAKIVCEKCGKESDSDYSSCPHCGLSRDMPQVSQNSLKIQNCSYCGIDLPYGTDYCQKCQTRTDSSNEIQQHKSMNHIFFRKLYFRLKQNRLMRIGLIVSVLIMFVTMLYLYEHLKSQVYPTSKVEQEISQKMNDSRFKKIYNLNLTYRKEIDYYVKNPSHASNRRLAGILQSNKYLELYLGDRITSDDEYMAWNLKKIITSKYGIYSIDDFRQTTAIKLLEHKQRGYQLDLYNTIPQIGWGYIYNRDLYELLLINKYKLLSSLGSDSSSINTYILKKHEIIEKHCQDAFFHGPQQTTVSLNYFIKSIEDALRDISSKQNFDEDFKRYVFVHGVYCLLLLDSLKEGDEAIKFCETK